MPRYLFLSYSTVLVNNDTVRILFGYLRQQVWCLVPQGQFSLCCFSPTGTVLHVELRGCGTVRIGSESLTPKHHPTSTKMRNKEKEKKTKYCTILLESTPFVVSCDGLIGKEIHSVLRNLAGRQKNMASHTRKHMVLSVRASALPLSVPLIFASMDPAILRSEWAVITTSGLSLLHH